MHHIRRRTIWLGAALLLISCVPYLLAWAVTPAEHSFTGLLFNPRDGNSYIAKMRQGLEGQWLFQLPYTPEPHDGAFVYLFYILAGHLARWVGLPLILVYHLVRLLSGAGMVAAIYGLAARATDDPAKCWVMVLLAGVGAGLGWLVIPFGRRTADLWVPEAFPVYALLANAHFPFGIGLMAWIGICGLELLAGRAPTWWGAGLALGAVTLGLVQPFGLLPSLVVLGVALIAHTWRQRAVPWPAATWIVVSVMLALPYPLYTQWAIQRDPILAAWSTQNETLSPPLWDWLLSFGLIAALAVVGIGLAIRRGSDADWLLVGWAGSTLVGMYLPLALQRRVGLGLGVPLGLLAGRAWRWIVAGRVPLRWRTLLRKVLIAISVMTPIFLIVTTMLAAAAGESLFYLHRAERSAFRWLSEEGAPDGVVLCAPETGIFVPAWAGQPVVYGHPFETVDAELREHRVRAYWTGQMGLAERDAFLAANRVRYVFFGPRERALDGNRSPRGRLVYQDAAVEIYEIDPQGGR